MRRIFIVDVVSVILSLLSPSPVAGRTADTVSQKMEYLKKEYSVKFVYDSSLDLDVPYSGPSLEGRSLDKALRLLLGRNGLRWERNGDYVVILPKKYHTVSGYVTQEDGETVINATVRDTASGLGTLTNEHGFYSLTLPEGKRSLRYSFIGFPEETVDVDLKSDRKYDILLHGGEQLDEVVVTADLNSPHHTTPTGKISLTPKDLGREFALLSSPDVVKTLQTRSGVAAGTELISGLYVHGGSHDENLFMIDGTPLYQVNHVGGLFSSFNTDMIKNIDFYKSGFPARYGGRLSSVVDVRTRDGNMTDYHGTFSIGLLDGRLQFEGPIVRNRTSFNVGLRRSWLDLITTPLQKLRKNRSSDDYFRTSFHDFNAKITHVFSDRSRADISIYSGEDVFKITDEMKTERLSPEPVALIGNEHEKIDLRWGCLTAAINWKYQFSSKFYGVFTGLYTYNHSINDYSLDDKRFEGDETTFMSRWNTSNHATINDGGYRMEFDYRPDGRNHIRMGSNYLMHFFRPQNYFSESIHGDDSMTDTVVRHLQHSFRGHEVSIYAEDDIAVSRRLRINAGLHLTLFNIPGKTYTSVEPRFAARYQCSDRLTLKTSFTEMSQFMHQLSNTYLNLPMDIWVPSTKQIHPSRSRQYAAGAYMMLPHNLRFSVEGYYKATKNLLEYDGGNNLTPPYEAWESNVSQGRGRSYGIEIEGSYGNERVSLDAAYTLSWSERNFPEYYAGWYPDKFDNRHKFNINLSCKVSQGVDLYAGWVYHTGNRMTVPQQLAVGPILPGPQSGYDTDYVWVYDQPNNIKLDDYHRLDLGVNFRKTGKSGRERIWNVSIYNVYSRMNPLYARIKIRDDGSYVGRATALSPIMLSFSYTLKF